MQRSPEIAVLRMLIVLAWFVVVWVVASAAALSAQGGFAVSGPLARCETPDDGCFHLNGVLYLQLSPELRRTAELLDSLVGREVVLRVEVR